MISTIRPSGEKKSSNGIIKTITTVAVIALSIAVKKTIDKDPLIYMIPNFLLFTPFHRYAVPVWKFLDPPSRLPLKNEHKIVRTIDASDYTFEKFQEMTENFRYPGVVKGLFLNTTALNKWTQKGYLSEKIGHFDVKVAWRSENETKIFNRTRTPFKEAYEELLDNEDYKGWLFFPFFSTSKKGVMANPLNSAVNKLVQDDLDLSRIWDGFGFYESHSSLVGHQFSMGRAKPGEKKGTTTFDWHCEPGSNWFAQISGSKAWYFMDPKYSSFMMTNHTGVGIRVLRTSDGDRMRDIHERLPLEKVVLEPGDLLYNPEWEWHTIKQSIGISVAVAMREFNVTNALRLNAQYTGVIAVNHFWKNIGLERLFKKDWWLF